MIEDSQLDTFSQLFQFPDETGITGMVPNEVTNILGRKDNLNLNLYPLSFTSLELLRNYNHGDKRKNGEEVIHPQQSNSTSTLNGRILSTEEVVRLAAARFIQSLVHNNNDISLLGHPFGYDLSGLSHEESQDIKLAHLLLVSAEKVGHKQYDRASMLLSQCEYLSCRTGNPVQRIVYTFAEALRERIDRETRKFPGEFFGGKERRIIEIEDALKTPHPAVLECYQLLPFPRVLQFSGIQAIVDNIASAKKVHLIDIDIKYGMQWTILMQALATRHGCPLEHLKITAIGTGCRKKIEETGKRLVSFAKNLNIPFTFKVLTILDMKDLKKGLLTLEGDEVVAIYSYLALWTMLHQHGRLENLMKVIKSLNPCIVVISEVEANLNSPVLMNRFTETLFYYSTFFDCLDVCMDRNNENRMIVEKAYLGWAINNIVANEGEQRYIRHVGIDIWRAFFKRFRLVEMELSESSLYQANLIVEKFGCGSSFTHKMNEKSLLIGWRGTPLFSLSIWKFQ